MDTSTATSSPDAAVSLSWVVNSVRDWVERCSSIWVEAQIIELKRRSGYQQFLTLHDVTEEVSATATCPRHVLDAAGPVEAGMTVFALIHPTVWRKSGRLSFVIAEIRPTGQGQLLAQLVELPVARVEELLAGLGLLPTQSHPRAPAEIAGRLGSHPQRQSGLFWVGAQPALGRLPATTLEAVADLDVERVERHVGCRRGGGRGDHGDRRGHRPPQAGEGEGARRHAHRQRGGKRCGGCDPGAHRRFRRRRRRRPRRFSATCPWAGRWR